MPRPNSRRQRALDQLQIAQDALAKALTLLGGRPRGQPRKLPAPKHYLVRGYIISCINRLDIAQSITVDEHMQNMVTATLHDDFERDYDKTRNPGC